MLLSMFYRHNSTVYTLLLFLILKISPAILQRKQLFVHTQKLCQINLKGKIICTCLRVHSTVTCHATISLSAFFLFVHCSTMLSILSYHNDSSFFFWGTPAITLVLCVFTYYIEMCKCKFIIINSLSLFNYLCIYLQL